MDCEHGHGPMIRGRKFWICEQCGYRQLITADEVSRSPVEYPLDRLPYPVALTASRFAEAQGKSSDVLKQLFRLKDCFEATIKFLGVVLLTEYFRSPACTPEHNESLLQKMVRPSLGHWVNYVAGETSLWLADGCSELQIPAPLAFAVPPKQQKAKPKTTSLLKRCQEFVTYRNDALGHGTMRSDYVYADDLQKWAPLIGQLLDALAEMSDWRLCLITDRDRCQVWMGPQPGKTTEPGDFRGEHVGHFVLRGRTSDWSAVRNLYPFICYLPDIEQENRLHFYDSIYRYQASRKEVQLLEYDNGFKQASQDPIRGLEEAFTTELLSRAFKRHQGHMKAIEGRVASFGELLEAHADIVGRRFAIDHVKRFIEEQDRGLLIIEAQPGKGKTALLCHLIENEFGHYSPPPVHFFYRRTAGTTDPDMCVKHLYAALLDAHNITENETSREQVTPEEMFNKLTNLLSESIAPRLSPRRPQLIFVDALDEAQSRSTRPSAFQRIPENLPRGTYVIATTRPVPDRTTIARRAHLCWYDLDAPDLIQANLRDAAEYVHRELLASNLPTDELDKIAQLGGGNFLVLKLLCDGLRARLDPAPDEVREFLGRLATEADEGRLGFIYQEFWNRIVGRLDRRDTNLLCDVAGLLVTARAPLSTETICDCLGLRIGDWDFALRLLAEYLTVIREEEAGETETYFRIYHESFADFLRAKVSADRDRYDGLLADYCLGWSRLPAGRGRLYALRFAIEHLVAVSRWDDLEQLLMDIFFLEARNEVRALLELVSDLATAVAALPAGRPLRRTLDLLGEAIRRDIQFIARHADDYPQALFQCLWNSGWWYDCEEMSEPYVEHEVALGTENPPWLQPEDQKFCRLLERWLQQKEEATPDFPWLRSIRPPPVPLCSGLLAVCRGHEHVVTSAAFSPSGDRIVSGSADRTVRVWDAQSHEELAVCRGHEHVVTSAAFSPSGDRVVSFSAEDKTVRVWDAASGEELAVLRGHRDFVTSAMFSPNGDQIVSGSWDGTVRIWDTASGEELTLLHEHRGEVRSVCYSVDGTRIANGSDDGTVRIWDAHSGAELSCLRIGKSKCVICVAFSQKGDKVVCGVSSTLRFLTPVAADVLVWDTRSADATVLRGHEDSVNSVAFSPDGDRVVSAADDGTVRIWDTATGKELNVLQGHEHAVNSVAFSSGGDRIVSASRDGTVRLWHGASGEKLAVFSGHEDSVESAAFSPDGDRIVSASCDGTVGIWEAARRGEGIFLSGHEDSVKSVTFSPVGNRVLSVSDSMVRVWDTQSGAELVDFGGPQFRSAHFSPGGDRIVTFSSENDPSQKCEITVRVWDEHSCEEVISVRGQEGFACVDFSAAGDRIVSRSSDGTVRIWDSRSGGELAILQGHDGPVSRVVFSPASDRIVSESDDSVRLWDATSGQELAILRDRKQQSSSVTFSPQGDRILVSVSGSDAERLWDATSGEELAVLPKNIWPADRLVFSASGNRMMRTLDEADPFCKEKTKVRVFDAMSGRELAVVRDLEPFVKSVALSPGGDRIVSVSGESVRLWDATSGEKLAVLHRSSGELDQCIAAFSASGDWIVVAFRGGGVRVWDARSYKELSPLSRQRTGGFQRQ